MAGAFSLYQGAMGKLAGNYRAEFRVDDWGHLRLWRQAPEAEEKGRTGSEATRDGGPADNSGGKAAAGAVGGYPREGLKLAKRILKPPSQGEG